MIPSVSYDDGEIIYAKCFTRQYYYIYIIVAKCLVFFLKKNTSRDIIYDVRCIYCIVNHLLDIDECDLDIDSCDQNCTNIDGSYTCTCAPGYNLNSDLHTCDGNSFFIFNSYHIDKKIYIKLYIHVCNLERN